MSEFPLMEAGFISAGNSQQHDKSSFNALLYFKFNEGKGDRFTDATGNGNEAWCNDLLNGEIMFASNANN